MIMAQELDYGGAVSRITDKTEWEEIDCPICGSSAFDFLFKKLDEPFVQCKDCSLVMINPRPIFDDEQDVYQEDYGKKYFAKKDKKFRRIRPWVRRVRRNYVPSGGRWLDVGCSVGFVVYCAKQAGFDAYGVDLDPWGLEFGRKELGLENLNEGTLESQGYADGFFDVISMYDVIEHVPDLNAFVPELKRILAPNGVIDVITPDVSHWRVPSNLIEWRAILPSQHLYNFSPQTLRQLFEKHGLKVAKKRLSMKPNVKYYITHA